MRSVVHAASALTVAALVAWCPGLARAEGGFVDAPRARIGVGVAAGPLLDAGVVFAFAGGGAARVGMQVSELVALYVAPRLTGAVSDVDGTTATMFTGGAVVGGDVTIDDRIQIGLGVGVDGMGSSWCTTRRAPCFAQADPGFAFEVRVAYVLAPWDYPMRGGFPVGLTWHTTVIPDAGITSSLLLSIGFELY